MAYCILHKDENNLCDQEALYCHDHAVRVGNAELRERIAELERHLEIAKDVITELSAAEQAGAVDASPRAAQSDSNQGSRN